MRALTFLFFALLGVFLVFTSLACGGSGGGGGGFATPSHDLLFGDYTMVWLRSTEGPPLEFNVSWGQVDASGAGTFDALAFTENDTGTVSMPVPGGTVEYEIYPDRSFAWPHPVLPGVNYGQGGIAANGSLASAATVWNGGAPILMLFCRRGGGTFDNALLDGTYHFCALERNLPFIVNISYFGKTLFDGIASAGTSAGINRDGVVPGPPVLLSAGYSVSGNGAITMDFGLGRLMEGNVLAGGDLVMLAGGTVTPEDPGIHLYVRESTAADPSTFSGTYHLAGIRYDVALPGYVAVSGTVQSDGVASAPAALTEVSEGVLSIPGSDPWTYAVVADGALQVTTGAGDTLQGAVSPDGTFAMLAGTANSGGDPHFYFLIR